MNKVFSFTLSLLFLCSPGLNADTVQRSDFRYLAPVEGSLQPEVPVSVPIGRDVISKTDSCFFDLRLFDNRGQETPFVIYAEVEPGEMRESFTFKIISFDSSAGEAVIVLQRPDGEGPFTGIAIHSPARDFRKSVRVLKGSAAEGPDSSWQEVRSGTIFDFSSQVDLRKTEITIPPTDADYIKVVVREEGPSGPSGQQMKLRYDGLEFEVGGRSGETFRIDRVTGFRGEEKESETVYDRKVILNPARTVDEDRNSVHDLGLVNLGVTRVRLQAGRAYYHRRVELWEAAEPKESQYRLVSAGTIYNFPGMEGPENTIGVQACRYRYVRLKIINRDNPPLPIPKIELEWPRQNLYFIPEEGRNYSLFFGGEEFESPEYEIVNIIKNDPAALKEYKRLALGTIRENAGYDPGMKRSVRSRIEKGALIAVVLLLVAALSFWLFTLMRRMAEGDGNG